MSRHDKAQHCAQVALQSNRVTNLTGLRAVVQILICIDADLNAVDCDNVCTGASRAHRAHPIPDRPDGSPMLPRQLPSNMFQ